MIQFEKGIFFIRVYDTNGGYLEKMKGIIFQYDGILFGADFRNKKWVVTELSTGMRIDNTPIKSKNGIEEYMKKRIDRIKEISKMEFVEVRRREFRELAERGKNND